MRFLYADGTAICDPIGTAYGSPINIPSTVPYQDESDLPTEEKYAFLGYALSPDAIAPLDMSRVSANQERTFFALFDRASVYSNPVGDEYLVFTEANPPVDYNAVETIHGYTVAINQNYKLHGKVTLPSVHNGLPIVGIADNISSGFANNRNGQPTSNDISHIFWDRTDGVTPQLRFVGSNSFNGGNYDYIELPATCYEIKNAGFSQAVIGRIDLSNVKNFGTNAFSSANLAVSDIQLTNAITLGRRSFGYVTKHYTLYLGSSSVESPLELVYNDSISLSDGGRVQVVVYTGDTTKDVWTSLSAIVGSENFSYGEM